MNRSGALSVVILAALLLSFQSAWAAEQPSATKAAAGKPSRHFAFQRTEDRIAVSRDGQPVGDYVFNDPKIPRPYLAGLRAPDGTQVTRNHPPVKGQDPVDHDTIHPGLWLAFGDLNGVDFWRNRGRIEQTRFVREPRVEADRFAFAVELRYAAPDGREVCRGTNEYRFVAGSALEPNLPGTLILIAAELRAGSEPLRFGPQHETGLGLRVASPLRVNGGSGSILGSHGGKNEGGNWGRAAEWWDYGGMLDGKRAGILAAAAARNPRPVWAHARDYGFLALNPTGTPPKPKDSEMPVPFAIAAGEALRMRFAVLLYAQPASQGWDAGAAGKAVAAALDRWSPESWGGKPDAPSNGASGQNGKRVESVAELAAVPTFECMSLYWNVADGSRDLRCAVRYREKGQSEWRPAQDLWYAAKQRQYRGSVVHLKPGTPYEFSLARSDGRTASIEGRTWDDRFPIASTTVLPAGTLRKTVRIAEGGTPGGYRLYTAAPEGTTVDVDGKEDTCLRIEADHVIVRGVKCLGARVDGVQIASRRHVVLEGCDISGWGRPDPKAGQMLNIGGKEHAIPARLGFYLDAGVRIEGPSAEAIVIQGNRIHHPRFTANNWTQVSPYFSRGGAMSTHPQGANAIRFDEITRGRHVIRWNDIYGDFEHLFYDALLAAEPKGNGFVCDGDIYGNRISHCWDDGLEAERGDRNVRIWGNHFSKMIKCISAGYIWDGPLYVFRNVAEDLLCPNEMPAHNGGLSPFKGHPPCFLPPPQEDPKENRDGVVFVYHNTLLPGVEGSVGTAAGWVFNAWHRFKYDTPTVRLISRNNVWITRPYPFYFFGANPQNRNFAVRDFARSYFDQDYDLHNGAIEPSATAGRHTLEKEPRFRQGHGTGSAGLYQLEPGTPGADDAVRLPNFNDDAQGAGPDRGAHEGGSGPMQFGISCWRPAWAP